MRLTIDITTRIRANNGQSIAEGRKRYHTRTKNYSSQNPRREDRNITVGIRITVQTAKNKPIVDNTQYIASRSHLIGKLGKP